MRLMRKARRSMLLFPKTMKLLFLGNGIAQPLSCVHDPYSLVLVFGLVGARNQHLGEGVLYRQQGETLRARTSSPRKYCSRPRCGASRPAQSRRSRFLSCIGRRRRPRSRDAEVPWPRRSPARGRIHILGARRAKRKLWSTR